MRLVIHVQRTLTAERPGHPCAAPLRQQEGNSTAEYSGHSAAPAFTSIKLASLHTSAAPCSADPSPSLPPSITRPASLTLPQRCAMPVAGALRWALAAIGVVGVEVQPQVQLLQVGRLVALFQLGAVEGGAEANQLQAGRSTRGMWATNESSSREETRWSTQGTDN
jgi:hypothetical protein